MSQPRISAVSVLVYGTLTVIGVLWCVWAGRPWPFLHPEPLALGLDASAWEPWVRHAISLVCGGALAMATVWLNARLVRRAAWARELHIGFRELLGRLESPTILALALSSGIGEEVFFRGALQPAVGWVIASLIFGLVHIGPGRRFLPWTIWAVLMGFLLGGIFELTGSLVGPLVAHVWINHENLHFIVRHDPRGPTPSEEPPLTD